MPKKNEDDNRIIQYDNDDLYEGDKDKRDRPHGTGTYIHHDERDQVQQGKYVGEWKDGEKHGNGKHYYRNGDVYDGPWVKGKRHGSNGRYFYHNKNPEEDISAEYRGDWEDDKKHGEGIMIFTNGDRYEGRWVKGNMEAEEAAYTYADRSKYVGAWKNDNKYGKGTLTYANGDIYEGLFKNGKRHGKGRYTFHDGLVTEGTYNDDRRADYRIISEKQPATTTSIHQDPVNNRRSREAEEVLA